MKVIITRVFLIILGIQLQAQTIIERKISLEGKNNVSVQLPYAKTIEVHTWAGNELYIKGKVAINNGRLDHKFEIKTKKRFSTLYVESTYGGLFKKNHGFFSDKDKSLTVKVNKGENENYVQINDISIDATYVLYMPKNITLSLESTSGNVTITSFTGNLIADSKTGDILVKDYEGNLTIKTVSGTIDLKIRNASSLKAKTTIGKILKKEHISKVIIGEKLVGSFATADFDGGKYSVDLSSVSGDIHLRK